MYSGTTLTKYSGRVFGAHQKLDRVAYRQLAKLTDVSKFPTIRHILHFEGKNGPDGIKSKSPARDEPWHYFNPFDSKDAEIINIIQDHYNHLVSQLKKGNMERSAFEAAWLAHALVDGLTPAHHYPYEEKLVELRGGEGIERRTTIRDKIIMPGETRRDKVKNNWRMWGPKGLLASHGFFEFGVASIIKPLAFGEAMPSSAEIAQIRELGVAEWFRRAAREIAVLDMYHHYLERGWTPKLAWQVRHKLGPTIVQAVTLSWYAAMVDAGLVE